MVVAFAKLWKARHPESEPFRGRNSTARTFAYLRIAHSISGTGARLATDSGGLTLSRTGFAPAGRQTKFHEGIASSNSSWPAWPGRTKAQVQVLSDRLVDRIREGGGEALAGQAAVEIILGEQHEVTGVRYRRRAGGEDQIAHAPVVFANASPHTVENMLSAAERDSFMAPYRGKRLSISLFSITLGLNQRPSALGVSAYSTMIIPEWVKRLSDFRHCAGLLADMPSGRLPVMGVCNYAHIDSGLVDGDLFPVSLAGADRLTNWEGLSDADYHAKKNAWLDAVIEHLST